MKDILNNLFEGKTLTKKESTDILTTMAGGEISNEEMAAFLTVFNMRPITAEELSGFREAMINLAVQVDLKGYNAVDVCGTGGDGKNTFNISTLSAFVIAGAGFKVIKHGNYSASSASGSSNVFEKVGYKFSNDTEKLKKDLETTNLCYLHAPLFHPAMKVFGPIRKALKVKTFFNILGPLINPAQPENQLSGVFSPQVQELYNGVFKDAGINYTVVHTQDGYDEISLTSPVKSMSNIGERELLPEDFGYPQIKPEELHGGNTVDEALVIFHNILDGKGTEAQNNVVIANAAMAIHTIHNEYTLYECMAMCKDALLTGKAKEVLNKLIEIQ